MDLGLSPLANLLAGDAADGTMPSVGQHTSPRDHPHVEPRDGAYRTRPLRYIGGPDASVVPTDAVRGVTAGQVVHVLHRGAASRQVVAVEQDVGIAAGTARPRQPTSAAPPASTAKPCCRCSDIDPRRCGASSSSHGHGLGGSW